MSLIKYRSQRDPFKEVFNLPLFWDPMLGFGLDDPSLSMQDRNLPAVDISEDRDHVYVRMDLPGFEKKDIRVSVNNGYLTIEAERKSEVDKKERMYHRIERTYGLYRRSIHVGSDIDESKVNAKYNNGVLDLTVTKAKPKDAKVIDVE